MSGLHSNCTTEPDTFRRVDQRGGAPPLLAACGEGADLGRKLCARGERHGGGGPPRAASQSDLRLRRQLRNRAAVIDGAVPEFVPVALAAPAGPGAPSVGGSSRIEVVAAGLTIRLGTGFDTGDLRRVLQIVRELS
jgi:hypothetical protein